METLFDHKTWMLLGTVCLASMVNITANIYFCPKESYKFWLSALACMATNIGCLFLAEYFTKSIKKDNAKINEVKEKKGKFLSDKEDARYHGLGISNISDIVDKYKGMLDITHTADEFTVTILIKDVS